MEIALSANVNRTSVVRYAFVNISESALAAIGLLLERQVPAKLHACAHSARAASDVSGDGNASIEPCQPC